MKENDSELVLEWFTELEDRLSAFLHTVNYSEQNRRGTFPRLANIIVDAGSIVDTILREEFEETSKRKAALNIIDYHARYEERLKLSSGRLLLYQYPPQYIEPFRDWSQKPSGKLTWWNDYNELKHNRISEYQRATLSTAVNTMGALFQVIASMNTFFESLLRRDMVDTRGLGVTGPQRGIIEWVDDKKCLETILIESLLFAFPRGREHFPVNIDDMSPSHFGGKRLVNFMGRSSKKRAANKAIEGISSR